jgi:pimeloyl-ACP methyl ester carboxylesterase
MIEKLVLVGPGLPGYKPPSDQFDQDMSAKYDAAIKAGDNALAAEINTQVWVDGHSRKPEQVNAEFRAWAKKLIRHTIDLGIGEGEGANAKPLAAERLFDVKAPTLLVIGTEDMQSIQHTAKKLEGGISGLRRVDMPGTAHLPPMEKPGEFNRIVLDFLLE